MDRLQIENLGWTFVKNYKCPFVGKDMNIYHIIKEIGFNTGSIWTLEEKANDFYEIKMESYSSYQNVSQNMLFKILSISDLSDIMRFANISK